VGGDEAAEPKVAGDRVTRDPFPHDRLGLLGQLPEQACARGPEGLLERGNREALARDHLAAVAARRPGADPRRLQQDHVITALGQVQGCRNAGEAATDHADVGVNRAGELRMVGHRVRCGNVVGIGVPRRRHGGSRIEKDCGQVQIRPATRRQDRRIVLVAPALRLSTLSP
jgi:hypothetical protein